ncbi:ATP-binding protein [Streptomyces chartreusis]
MTVRQTTAGRRLVAEDGTPVATKAFLRDPESVPDARRFVHSALVDWKMPDLADTAELVVSELASNAVLHARCGAFRVTLRQLASDRVRVAVVDRSRTLPQLANAGDDEDHGRGLAIIDALSQRWGTEPLSWGKRVWADLEAPQLPESPIHREPLYTSPRAQLVYVLIVLAVAVFIAAAVYAQN